ncbi:MAG: hydantoinase/oxoprolinase family protein, partial [Acidobacteriota bacterium]
RRFPMVAFGGAGPVHAYRIARSLACPTLLLPLGAGVMSTVGFLGAPLAFDFVRSWVTELEAIDWQRADALFAAMEAEGEALLHRADIDTADIAHRRQVDMRYVGQGHEIAVDAPSGALDASAAILLRERFETAYRELYERSGPPVAVEILNWRVVSSGPTPRFQLRVEHDGSATGGFEAAIKGHRPAYFPESNGFVETPVIDRYRLRPGMRFDGPAIVEERESTVIVGGGSCTIDAHHNLVVTLPSLTPAPTGSAP